jgi:hypothetical protein
MNIDEMLQGARDAMTVKRVWLSAMIKLRG